MISPSTLEYGLSLSFSKIIHFLGVILRNKIGFNRVGIKIDQMISFFIKKLRI